MAANPESAAKRLSALLSGFDTTQPVPDLHVSDITNSSHKASAGSLFVALQGRVTHGIDFAIDAVQAGAIAVMYDARDEYCRQRIRLLGKQIQTHWIGVDDLDRIHGEIASRFYGEPSQSLTIIGITGTDGKTSVTQLITQALCRLDKLTASIGTLGYGVGGNRQPATHTTPDAITLQSCLHQFRQQQCEYVVMEVSSHALDQYRVNGCDFDIAVLTNLGRDHLDYHQTTQQYAAAKARLFREFELSAKVVNADDDFGRSLCGETGAARLIRFSSKPCGDKDSLDNCAEVRLIKSGISDQGIWLQLESPVGKILANTGLIGRFNIENILACISALAALGFDREQIQHAVTGLQPIPGRMERFKGAIGRPVAIVDFAHTEQALRSCLLSCREYTSGKLWCVFGCGGERDQGKRKGMGRAAEQLADHVIVTDDNPRTEDPAQIAHEILAGMSNPARATVIHNRLAAIEFALSAAGADDLVAILGKGHEIEQIIGHQRYPFSDRQVVQRILQVES